MRRSSTSRSQRPDLLDRSPTTAREPGRGWAPLVIDPVRQLRELADLHHLGLRNRDEYQPQNSKVLDLWCEPLGPEFGLAAACLAQPGQTARRRSDGRPTSRTGTHMRFHPPLGGAGLPKERSSCSRTSKSTNRQGGFKTCR
jgi:hypothetical protein